MANLITFGDEERSPLVSSVSREAIVHGLAVLVGCMLFKSFGTNGAQEGLKANFANNALGSLVSLELTVGSSACVLGIALTLHLCLLTVAHCAV